MITTAIEQATRDSVGRPTETDHKVSARLWLYPPRLRSGTVPSQAIIAAANTGVDVDIGDVSIGIGGACHNVFTAIEQIFRGMGSQSDLVLIATVQREAP
jgi:hypothetical protein